MKLTKVFTIIMLLSVVMIAGCKKDDNSDGLAVVLSVDPVNNQKDVERNKDITITFVEEMDPLTINSSTFSLKLGTTDISGMVSYSGTKAVFTPTNQLIAETNYTATLTIGAKNLAGESMNENMMWSFTTGGSTARIEAVNLRTSGEYVILAKTAITNNLTSVITGNLGLSPSAASYITGLAITDATGYATSLQVSGKIFAADMEDPTPAKLTTAINDMSVAYNDAADRLSPDFFDLGTGNIGGKTLSPGVYKWTNNVMIPTDVIFSGNESDVWILQIAGNLSLSPSVNIILSGGAQAKNIFWQVAGQATLSTSSHFEGIIMSITDITFHTDASINGRALAQTAVILNSNAVTEPL